MDQSFDCWVLEHRDASQGVYMIDKEEVGGYDEDGPWTTWRTQMTFDECVNRLGKLATGNKYFDYRIRNIQSGEIIPGEIFCR